MNIFMGSPKTPKMPDPPAPQAKLVDLESETEQGGINFEAELKRLRKKSQTTKAGETGGYGGSTNLG